MTIALSWTITVLVVVLLVTLVFALVSLRRIPLGKRPKTPTFDRLGRLVGMSENPDYHVGPGEEHEANPDHDRPSVSS